MKRSRISVLAVATALAASAASLAATAPAPNATITGEVGAISDGDAAYGGYYLRYTGNPAPAGFSHSYQWGAESLLTEPAAGPVVLAGSIDLSAVTFDNQVATIGLVDATALANGDGGYQTGAYIYLYARSNGNLRVALTDGNAGGGELIQAQYEILAANVPAVLDVTLTVDGTADAAACAAPAGPGEPDGDGCMTLEIVGQTTITDSYGVVKSANSAAVEFADGAYVTWEAYPAVPLGITYDLTVGPIVVSEPESKDDCKKDGYEDYGFANQGQCIRFVNTGQDSREA